MASGDDADPDEEGGAEELGQDGKGRLSRKEDVAFVAAIENLKERMRKVQDEDEISRVYYRSLGGYGVEKPLEIRSRTEREKFYRELVQQCEQWEAYSRVPSTE